MQVYKYKNLIFTLSFLCTQIHHLESLYSIIVQHLIINKAISIVSILLKKVFSPFLHIGL